MKRSVMQRLLMIVVLVMGLPVLSLCQSGAEESSALKVMRDVSAERVPLVDTLEDEQEPAQGSQPAQSKDDEGGRVWASAEYLLWKMKRSNVPPLITTGPESGDAIIGEAGTIVAFGGDKLDRGKFPGGRFIVGVWLNGKRNVGVELSYLFLKERTFNSQVSSSGQTGSQVITRPYFNVFTGKESGLLIAFPPISRSGSSSAESPSKLLGGEANFIHQLDNIHCCRASLLAGFRYLELNEQLTITDIGNSLSGRHFEDTDQFSTLNRFYGGQVGMRSTFSRGSLSLELSGTIALGRNRESVEINGSTFDSLNLPNNRVGGVLALISNIGHYRRNEFTVLPEVRANLGYNITHSFRAFVGYDFFYWNHVVRPGEQIDRAVNPNLVPSGGTSIVSKPLQPAFNFHSTAFWAQGLTTGVKIRF